MHTETHRGGFPPRGRFPRTGSQRQESGAHRQRGGHILRLYPDHGQRLPAASADGHRLADEQQKRTESGRAFFCKCTETRHRPRAFLPLFIPDHSQDCYQMRTQRERKAGSRAAHPPRETHRGGFPSAGISSAEDHARNTETQQKPRRGFPLMIDL